MEYLRNDNYKFAQYKREIIGLFKEAGLQDFSIIHQEFMGYGQFANMTISGFDNMTSNRLDIVRNMNMRFNEAIGVFRKRYKESLNPLFWIEYIFKLPQFLFEFFGVLPEKVVVKVFLVIYWLFALLFGLKKFDLFDHLIK
ncbi:hypothetical protein [Flavobacterium filum]|uniref:hypothetical protein n=1 Tax=Flavobacterium filum TaxID=370974 RepID=UPI0023EF92A9|nr:hypothetical protein [Flavobacterium filum]